MELPVVLWLVLLAALAVLSAGVARRMAQLVARTRRLDRLQSAVESLDRRFAAAVEPLVHALDDARRQGAADPAEARRSLPGVQAVLDELRAECRALPAPPVAVLLVAAMADDLDRAARAASLVEHGLGAMAGTSMGRDLEAQTSLKRGALNLRHAQDAFAARAREIAALRPADLVPGARPVIAAAPLAVYQGSESDPLEGRFDPRM